MYKFIKTKDPKNDFDTMDIEMSIDTVHLQELLQYFEDFLRGSGFEFDGSITISKEDDSLLK